MTDDGPDPEDEPGPRWASLEVAWPLSLFGGFAGTWAGLATGFVGVAAGLATAAVAPLHLALVRRGEPGRAALVGLGWGLGIAGAVLGSVFEGAGEELSGVLFGARAWAEVAGGGPSGPAMALHLAVFAAALLLSRWSEGLAALLAAAFAFASVALLAGERALPEVSHGAHSALATLAHLPLGLTAEAVALVLAGAASGSVAGTVPVLTRAPDGHSDTTRVGTSRPLIAGALGLEFLALAGWSLG